MIQYIRKGTHYLQNTERLDNEGDPISGSGRRSKGYKKGVMIAGIDENNDVVIGFSMCHPNDKFDYINGEWTESIDKMFNITKGDYIGGKRVDGFGKEVAIKRAIKWKNFTGKSYHSADEASHRLIPVPRSIKESFERFCERAIRYYKDKRLPAWI